MHAFDASDGSQHKYKTEEIWATESLFDKNAGVNGFRFCDL